MFLLFQSSFRLSEKNKKDKKRKVLTPVSATPTHMLRICVNSRLALSAGVQTMRARICSALSCDMFARVVWLKPRRAQNYRFLLCSVPYTLATHCFPRLTRARRQWFGRRTARVLLADFWYFWSCKSTIRENLLYDSSLSEFFSLVRKERKGQKEERIPLLNTFRRLAATSANKVP